jgi:hypothetical protein
MYDSLADHDLIHSYQNAVQMQLDQEFIMMLLTEIERRKLRKAKKPPFETGSSFMPDLNMEQR